MVTFTSTRELRSPSRRYKRIGNAALRLEHATLCHEIAMKRASLICFSHLRWDFVFQRPQQLMTRMLSDWQVFFWQEPVHEDCAVVALDVSTSKEGVVVVTPHLPRGLEMQAAIMAQRQLLDAFVLENGLLEPLLWYYTPQALPFSAHLTASLVVYDCMDELSAFRGADPALPLRERDLLRRADLVFTGGFSLYEVKRQQHAVVHPLPSGVDVAHFRQARAGMAEPADQGGIPHPRLGFYGVIDERLDLGLLRAVAQARPEWQIVLVGPVAKLDPAELPRLPNIHYLGMKSYTDLPAYLSGWDVALLPFALNEATRFISPTKTPEYLAAGRPVVSTPVVDVVRHYGTATAVGIAGSQAEFVAAIERALELGSEPKSWLVETDALLATASWDGVWARMASLIRERIRSRVSTRICGSKPQRAKATGFDYDVLVVGAGFAGAVLAERFASDGSRVLLIDRREHVGGNAYDHPDKEGVLVHRYGPHIFHTNAEQIVRYLSRFTSWRPYEHRVRACVGGGLLPIPINRTTINSFFGLELAEHEVTAFLASKALAVSSVATSEDVVLGTVGPELYEAFFRGYTRKQWGLDPSELDKSVTARIPTRTNDDDRYFGDSFQAMPRDGYTRMFENMLDHPNITCLLGVDYTDVQDEISSKHVVYTGPIDEFFGHRYGKLPYRSLRFVHQNLDLEQYQPVAVVNYPSSDVAYTRVTEFKHLTGQRHRHTSICYEFPSDMGDPYYPVPRAENAELYSKYRALADARPDVTFVGRLATYRYYNMDQVVGQALATYKRLSESGPRRTGTGSSGRAKPDHQAGNLHAMQQDRGAGY